MHGIARLRLVSLFALALLAACGGGGSGSLTPPAVVLDPSYYTDKYHYDNADTFLGRGINMGNYLEGDGGETAWSGRLLEEADFTLVAAAGFKTVRLPVRWSQHAATQEPYTIDSTWLNRVKTVVGWARAHGLKVVLNTHHYNEMFATGADLTYHRARLHAIWSQLCDAFPTDAYPVGDVVFELLNEPNGAVGYSQWNDIVADLTALIWNEKGQAGRKIMIGTANWGGPTGLQNLTLPSTANPDNTIITIHWYEPMHFTHQGASWVTGMGDPMSWIGTPWLGSDADQKPLLDLLTSVTDWNADPARGFEIFVGEFGAYGLYARPEYRKAWTAFIAREAEKRGMSWAYWEFDQGFGAFDRAHLTWRPELLDALIPAEDRPALNEP